jgi:hypothetical protein
MNKQLFIVFLLGGDETKDRGSMYEVEKVLKVLGNNVDSSISFTGYKHVPLKSCGSFLAVEAWLARLSCMCGCPA